MRHVLGGGGLDVQCGMPTRCEIVRLTTAACRSAFEETPLMKAFASREMSTGVLRAYLSRQLALPDRHCALSSSGGFPSGYRECTGALWKDFIVLLGTAEKATWPQSDKGAQRTFNEYQAVFCGWCDERVSS